MMCPLGFPFTLVVAAVAGDFSDFSVLRMLDRDLLRRLLRKEGMIWMVAAQNTHSIDG